MNDQHKREDTDNSNMNEQRQGVDKAPGEEKGKAEQVSNDDLKGKKVDADPEKKEDRPSH
jgi:hypothetical protein